MNRLFYLLLVVFLSPCFVEAQVAVSFGNQSKLITYTGKIVDAETGEPLPFAQINHIYKLSARDSMIIRNLIADKDGKFEIQSPRVTDNRIEVVCLGYKILTRMLSEAGNQARRSMTNTLEMRQVKKQQPEIYNQFDLGILKLSPDVQQLDEVTVKARIKLFEREGDTLLVFPKNIKQFEGDVLVDLLKRHPSFHVTEQGDIYVDGEKIERAMLNNKHIFGEDVKTMVHSILAKEAGLIKVYDEIDETSEILEGKEFAKKRRVMDVITFKDFNLFKGGEVNLEAGLYADKDGEGKQKIMHDANGRIGQYAANFRIAAKGNTRETAFPQRKQETGAGINAEVSSTDLLKSIGIGYSYGKDEQEQENRTEQFYFPTTYFESQISEQSNNSLQDKNSHKFGLTGKYIRKSVFSLTGEYSGSIEDMDQQSLFLSNLIKDGEQLSYLQQLRESSNRNHNHTASLKLTSSLKKSGSIQLDVRGMIAKKSEEGIRVDTSYTRGMVDKQIFSISGERPNYNIVGGVKYQKNIEKFSVGYRPSIRYDQSDQLYLAVDRLTGDVDPITSRDQIRKNLKISNEIFSAIHKNGCIILVTINYNTYKFQLKERFPESLQTDKRFHSWNGTLNVASNKFKFLFHTSDNPFPIQYLSTRLRDDNPMNLNTGNPNLKMGKNYAFSCNFNLKEALRLDLEYKIVTDPILHSRRYFETNTPLEEFGGYEALAGATLTTPVNAKKYNNFSLIARSNSKRGAILVRGYLSYSFEDPETDLLGEIIRSYMHRTSGSVSLISNFSSTFRLDIGDRVSYSHTKIKAEESQKNNWISNHLTGKATLNLFYRMMVNVNYMYSYNYNSRSKQTNNLQTLNASIDYRIFSNRRGLVSLNAYNLLNTRSSLTTTSTDLYIQNAYRPENSTLITVSFRYKFGVEQ